MTNSKADDFLAHYGVKGMKWGVRKSRDSSDSSESRPSSKLSLKDPKVRKAAIAGAGVVAVVAGAFIASRIMDTKMDPSVVENGMAKVKDILEKPTDIIYMSKPGKEEGVTRLGVPDTGFRFISKGGIDRYFTVFDDAGLNSPDFHAGDFRKLPSGDVAALFNDLSGRKDAATRPVSHAVFIPADKAIGLDSIEDVIEKYGPELERRYTEHMIEARKNST